MKINKCERIVGPFDPKVADMTLAIQVNRES